MRVFRSREARSTYLRVAGAFAEAALVAWLRAGNPAVSVQGSRAIARWQNLHSVPRESRQNLSILRFCFAMAQKSLDLKRVADALLPTHFGLRGTLPER